MMMMTKKLYIETIRETVAEINQEKLTVPKGIELVFVPNCGAASGYAVKDKATLTRLGVFAQDAEHYYAYVPKKDIFKASLLCNPESDVLLRASLNNWKKAAYKWYIEIAGVGFIYYTPGSFREPPTYDMVLESLLMDSEVLPMLFKDWCDELGYNQDSRSVLETYNECCDNARKLIKTGIDIDKERERIYGCKEN